MVTFTATPDDALEDSTHKNEGAPLRNALSKRFEAAPRSRGAAAAGWGEQAAAAMRQQEQGGAAAAHNSKNSESGGQGAKGGVRKPPFSDRGRRNHGGGQPSVHLQEGGGQRHL